MIRFGGDKYNYKDGIIQVDDKLSFQVHGTSYGDGTYSDKEGNSYPVDSGTLALIPIELVTKTDELNSGRVIKGNKGYFIYNDGIFTFFIDGKEPFSINTNSDEDEEPDGEDWTAINDDEGEEC